MSADIILFVPKANQKSDKAFWMGPHRDAILNASEPTKQPDTASIDEWRKINTDTSPSEYVAPPDDCA